MRFASHLGLLLAFLISTAVAQEPPVDFEDDVIGKSDFDFYTKEYASLAKAREQKIIDTGEPIIGIEEKE